MKSDSPPQAIDWEVVHRAMAQTAAASEAAQQWSPERAREIMDERARLLARTAAAPPDQAGVIQLVAFRLGAERFGLETRYVHEVFPVREVTPVPGTPDFVLGVTNLRGQVLAIMDLRGLLGVTQPNAGNNSQVLVIGIHRPEFGVLTDAVEEVLELPNGNLLDVPPTIAPESRHFFRGVTKDALAVLAGDVLLQDARLFVDDDGKSLFGTSEESS